MSSTTNTKKEIIDFLWEWAEAHGTWGKMLVDTIVRTENALTSSDRGLVFDYFIDSLRKTKILPTITIAKPIFLATSKTITLSSLSGITGVNRLAAGQKMTFSDNITVVYGENGTGKTGYGRILKSLGFSYDTHNNVFNNIFSKAEPKSATIEFNIDLVPESFIWTGGNTHPALTNISVFNNNCVQISLADRRLIVSPIGFHLFGLVTTELAELTKLLQAKVKSFPITLLCAASLSEGTPQHTFITKLSDKSLEQTLIDLSTVKPDIETTIAQKEKALTGLNKELLNTQIQSLNSQISELKSVNVKLEHSRKLLNETSWLDMITLNEKVAGLEGKSKVGLKDIAEQHGIKFYETEEFKNFITSAEDYINVLEKSYPEIGDTCVYCNQPLEASALTLLHAYKNLLNDNTAAELKLLTDDKVNRHREVKLIEINTILHHASFGLDSEGNVIQPIELTNYNQSVKKLNNLFCSEELTKADIFDLDYGVLIVFFENKMKELNVTLAEKREALDSIIQKAAALQAELNELNDRKILNANVEEIKTVIKNMKSVSLLNSKTNEFGTNSISRKTTEARDELVSHNFNAMFQQELAAFRKSHLKIDLSFGTDRGNSKISQKINQCTLTDILSEGEQKAIALAEFLTELQLDHTKAPVVFDDPVNSLDHKIIDEVSKRLIDLSKTRQVIVFTHNILLLNSFIQQAELPTNKQAGVVCQFHGVRNQYETTGLLDEIEEINSLTYYTKKLEVVLKCADKGISEEQLASEGYGHLRSAIEVCVEEDILKNTIRRYRKGVAFPSLLRIDGSKIDAQKGKLNDVYEKCCVSIFGHSSPTELHTTPTITDLKVDYESFKVIRSAFR